MNRHGAGMAKSRKSARLPPMWPGLDSGLRGYMSSWVCCWFSRLAPRVFLRVLRFSSLHKNQHSKFQFDQNRGPAWKPAKADVAFSSSKYWKCIVFVPFVLKRFFSSLPVFLYFSCHCSFIVNVCHLRSWYYSFYWKRITYCHTLCNIKM